MLSVRASMLLTAIVAALHGFASWLLPEKGLLFKGWGSIQQALRNGRDMTMEETTTLAMHSAFLFMGTFLALRLARTFQAEVSTLTQRATRDPLTQLPNRRGFNEKMTAELARAQRFAWPIAVLMLDLDHFKRVNDQYGHAFGDAVLVEASRILRDSAGPVDHLARTGGEEFAIAAVAAEPDHGEDLARRVLRRFRDHPWAKLKPGLKVTCSIGVAILDPTRGAQTSEERILATLLDQADKALYEVKQQGRDNYRVYEGSASTQHDLAHRL
jgi:diguanylate cyclase (GGDEF)-like protein